MNPPRKKPPMTREQADRIVKKICPLLRAVEFGDGRKIQIKDDYGHTVDILVRYQAWEFAVDALRQMIKRAKEGE